MRGTYEACPFGLPPRMNEIQRGQSDQATFIFLSWKTYPVKAQRWNKSVYIELARTPFKPLF